MYYKFFTRMRVITAAICLAILSSIWLVVPTASQAFSSVSFLSCPNPGGNTVASYNDGWHWIVGNGQLQWGSDTVYNHGNNTYSQCFCPLTVNNQPTGALGTQTDWIFAGNMSSSTKQLLLNSGWVSIPDGSAFGLISGEFLSRNSSFVCGGNSNSSTQISQSNNATFSNNVFSSINTGGNKASFNTGGSSSITTGNASSVVNISNSANMNSLHIAQQQISQIQAQISNNGAFSSSSIFLNH